MSRQGLACPESLPGHVYKSRMFLTGMKLYCPCSGSSQDAALG